MDEATIALDNKTESNLIKAISNLNKDFTFIFIAHRISTIRECDCIYEFQNGEISAFGKYNELLFISVAMTRAPCSAKATAVALPIPAPAAVITAVFPLSLINCSRIIKHYITAPICHGTNSEPPNPSFSLLVL